MKMDKQEFAKIVQAWADGEEIEKSVYSNHAWSEWSNCQDVFIFDGWNKYRVKPKIKTVYVSRSMTISNGQNPNLIYLAAAVPPSNGDYVEINFDVKTEKFLSAKIVEA